MQNRISEDIKQDVVKKNQQGHTSGGWNIQQNVRYGAEPVRVPVIKATCEGKQGKYEIYIDGTDLAKVLSLKKTGKTQAALLIAIIAGIVAIGYWLSTLNNQTVPVTQTSPTVRTLITQPKPQERPYSIENEWNDIKDSTNVTALQVFANRHHGTPFGELARNRIRELIAAQSRYAGERRDDDSQAFVEHARRPIEQLYRSWQRMDLAVYLAQWHPDGFKFAAKTGRKKDIRTLENERRALFSRISSANVRYRLRLERSDNVGAWFHSQYELDLLYPSGRTYRERSCERYRVVRLDHRWVIYENQENIAC